MRRRCIDELLDLIRDREVLQHVLAEVAGENAASANERTTGKIKRGINGGHHDGHSDAKRAKQLRRAIRKLPRLQRTIFWEIRFEDLSYEEIAARHDLSAAEVEAVFRTALMNFMLQLNWKPRSCCHWR